MAIRGQLGDGGLRGTLVRILRVGFGKYAVNLTVGKTLTSYIYSHQSGGTHSIHSHFRGSQTGQAPLSSLNKGQTLHLVVGPESTEIEVTSCVIKFLHSTLNSADSKALPVIGILCVCVSECMLRTP